MNRDKRPAYLTVSSIGGVDTPAVEPAMTCSMCVRAAAGDVEMRPGDKARELQQARGSVALAAPSPRAACAPGEEACGLTV